jgi:hypothetical protein
MCGLLADGNKATGFKSMVVAQFTGIGLQKDDNAFVLYDNDSGVYQDSTVPGNETISTNSRSTFKPNIATFTSKQLMMHSFRTYQYLRLVMQNTSLLRVVEICLSPTPTQTLVQRH